MPQKYMSIWQSFRQHRISAIVGGHVVLMAALAVMLLGNGIGRNFPGTHAYEQAATQQPVTTQAVVKQQSVVSKTVFKQPVIENSVVTTNHSQMALLSAQKSAAVAGTGNYFPFGQCTYWANQRYHQLHGVYVPWTTNSNAYQWTARAAQFGWHVSNVPTVGAIIQLDPWVQGATALGHVAIVESISGGHVVASNMNWNGLGSKVSNWNFTPGPGVHFITY
jgi:N-acetylmuramoyl-L-alanine amidase